jgi:hypothetical protein
LPIPLSGTAQHALVAFCAGARLTQQASAFSAGWKDHHDAYQKVFARILRDLKVETALRRGRVAFDKAASRNLTCVGRLAGV